ncbi:hypothetical protein BC629DRAFT_398480 [Irpex lacteus]|nr:hypothetical protein BC629DRAFT_398480 [Irpex lacteus]
MRKFLMFLTSIDSPPSFCRLVHTLCLNGQQSDGSSKLSISPRRLSSLLSHLPGLRVLELQCLDVKKSTYGRSTTKSGPLPEAKRYQWDLDILFIRHMVLGEHALDDFMIVLGSFSRLEVLCIDFSEAPGTASRISTKQTTLRNKLRATQLLFRGLSPLPDGLLDALLSADTADSLRSIELSCRTMKDVESAGQFFRRAGEHLQDVSIDISDIIEASSTG